MKRLFVLLLVMILSAGCKSTRPQKIVFCVESTVSPGHSIQKIPVALKVEYHFDQSDDSKVIQVGHRETSLEK